MLTDSKSRNEQRLIGRIAVVALALILTVGCNGYPEVASRESIVLIAALRTACNTRSAERLGRVEEAIGQARTAGNLSDAEQTAFGEIVATAHAGDWEAAERACADFQAAQIN